MADTVRVCVCRLHPCCKVGADDRPTPEALLVHFFSTLEYAWMKPALVQPFGHLREGRAKSKAPATLKVAVAQAEVYEKSGAVPEGWGRPYEAISKAKAKGGGKKASEAAARKRKAGGVADEAGELQLTKRERRVRVMRQLGLMAPEDSPYARGAAKAK